MAAPVLANRSVCFVSKLGTDDAGYNAVGSPNAKLTIAAALTDLAANYPAASATNPHFVSIEGGTYDTPAFALPPFTFVVGNPDSQADPTSAVIINLSGNITLAAGWNVNQTAFGGLANLTIVQSTSQNIDLTFPAPAAGNPARTVTVRNIRTNCDNLIGAATGTGDVYNLRNLIQNGATNDAVSFTGGTLLINNLESAAPVSINANTIAMSAQAYGIFITAATGLTCAALGSANCTVRLGACDNRALTLNEVAAGVIAVSADAVSIPLVGAITFSGTATDADLTRTTDGGSIAPGSFTNMEIAATGYFGWLTRSRMRSPSDGNVTLLNNAENNFSLLQFGGVTNSFPALKRLTSELEIRLADDSAYANINAQNVRAEAGQTIYFNSRSILSSPADSIFLLRNNAANNFDRLQFGGTTSSFPALSRIGATLRARLADDSNPTSLFALEFISQGASTTVSAGQISYGGTTQTTVGAAGAASALPVQPTGYVIINVAGTNRVVPFYAAA